MQSEGLTRPTGSLGLRKIVRDRDLAEEFPTWPARPVTLKDVVELGTPQRGLPDEVNTWRLLNLSNLFRGYRKVAIARAVRLPHFHGQLFLTLLRGDGSVVELGLASMRVVTTAGVNYIVDAFQGTVEPENLRFHGFGTGAAAEAIGDTALGTEETTQYATDNTRPTGTLGEGASANIYRTVATYSPDSGGTRAITEHGIFSQAATGGGTLLDRSVFAAVNLVAGSDSLQATYDFTIAAGG